MNYYSPHTGELIETATPSDWMGKTDATPPAFDRATQGCFFRNDDWVIVTAMPPKREAREILTALAALDAKSIRALREGDTARLATIEAQAVTLRAELAAL